MCLLFFESRPVELYSLTAFKQARILGSIPLINSAGSSWLPAPAGDDASFFVNLLKFRAAYWRVPSGLGSRHYSQRKRRQPVIAREATTERTAQGALASTASKKCSIVRRIPMPRKDSSGVCAAFKNSAGSFRPAETIMGLADSSGANIDWQASPSFGKSGV